MAIHPIPPGFHTVTPYFILKGADEFTAFVIQVFGGTLEDRHPTPDGMVMHASIKIGDSMIELSEAKQEWPERPLAIHLYVPDTDAIYQKGVEAGAISLYEPKDQPYGERGAGIRDCWKNDWYIATRTAPWQS